MNKLIQAIEKVDVENVNEVNKLLRNIHIDALYFRRTGNLRELRLLADTLSYFASINSIEVNQSWVKQKYRKGLGSLAKLCKELHG